MRTTIRDFRKMICLMTAAALLTAGAANAGPREQAKRLHDRLTGIPPTAAVLDSMTRLIEANDAIGAAMLAMDNPEHTHFRMLVLSAFTPAALQNRDDGDLLHERVWMRPVVEDELLDACFTPIARDGAGIIEVVETLQTVLEVVAGFDDAGFRRAALALSETVCELALAAMVADAHKVRVRKATARVAMAGFRPN